MIIVAGRIVVESEQRESYLQSCVEVNEQGRSAPGCLDFALTTDLVTAGRINVFERWESAGQSGRFAAPVPARSSRPK
jgi:quinol monooxygenase YgiN